MSRRNPNIGIQVVCIGILILSVVGSIFVGTALKSVNNKIDEYTAGIKACKNGQAANEANIDALRTEKEITKAKYDTVAEDLEYAKKWKSYETERICYLTFDDGPSKYTDSILDILDAYDIKGTFFIVGQKMDEGNNVKRIQRMAEEGHVIAYHCNVHDYPTIYASYKAYMDDFTALQTRFDEIGVSDSVSKIIRMPGGSYSAKGFFKKYANDEDIYYRVLSDLELEGYVVCDWNVDTEDYNAKTAVSTILNNAISETEKQLNKKYKTIIVLMHSMPNTAEALPQLIEQLKTMGYSFEPLTEKGYTFIQSPLK